MNTQRKNTRKTTSALEKNSQMRRLAASSRAADQPKKVAQNPQKKATSPRKTSSAAQPSKGRAQTAATVTKHNKKRMKKRRLRIMRFFTVAVAATILGAGGFVLTKDVAPSVAKSLRADWTMMLASTATIPFSQQEYNSLATKMRAYLNTVPGTVGVSLLDINSGAAVAIHGTATYSAAETLALPVTMTLYSDIAQGLLKPTDTVALTAADLQAGPGYIGGMPLGTSFTYAQLAKAAVVRGDVVAINMLMRALGPDQVSRFSQGLGSDAPMTPPYTVTPVDLTKYMVTLYTMAQAHKTALAPLLQDLAQVPTAGRLQSGLSGSSVSSFYHVLGNWPNQFHDSALFVIANRPLALSVCTEGMNETTADIVEKNLSAMVAQFVKQQMALHKTAP